MENLSPKESAVKTAWTALQVADKQQQKRGLDFGRACYELREECNVQGRRNDLLANANKCDGFMKTLERLNISYDKANYWIVLYEKDCDLRPPRVKQDADVVQVEHSASSREMAYQTDPSAPISRQTELQKLNYRLEGIIEALAQILAEKKWKKDPEYSLMKKTVKKLIRIAGQL